MREILDEVPSETARPVFSKYLARLQRGKYLERFQLFPGQYLCPIDASQYFGSENISCPHCLIKEHKGGKTSYSHLILQVAIVHPTQKQVIPLMPEERKRTYLTSKACVPFRNERMRPSFFPGVFILISVLTWYQIPGTKVAGFPLITHWKSSPNLPAWSGW